MSRSRYLEFGGVAAATDLDEIGTLEYLQSAGFDGGALGDTRDLAVRNADSAFKFEPVGKNYCDFCFAPIMGAEYDRLRDGRERCVRCSATVIATTEELAALVTTARRYFELTFDTSLDVAIDVRMVNAKEIAKRSGERFTPTSGVDARVLGFATSDKSGYSLFIENGSPALATITTVVHELTHIWQYLNWDPRMVALYYGEENSLIVHEGMATWAQVQYLLSTGERQYAARQQAYAEARDDEYGEGFRLFAGQYPLRSHGIFGHATPFDSPRPL